MKRPLLVVFICFSLANTGFGQKVKYKDLFVLLNAKQFEQAEPFLKKYLKDNDDNPNAYLFMGQIYQDKCWKSDVLKETETCGVFADSAVYFYDKAHKGITEKEIKKNDEYYQSYSRRDLRTGEFGIKLSDIQLDIEKRMQDVKERKQRVAQLKSQFMQTESLYGKAVSHFKNLQAGYTSYRELLLRSDEKTMTSLDQLGQVYDSAIQLFNAYKITLTKLGKVTYAQTLNVREINDFKADLGAPVDFYADELKLYDFKKWTESTSAVIHNDVAPMRKELISYDIEINKLAERVKKDSVVVTNELKGIEAKLNVNPVAKYDPAPMPMEVFKMKISELRYASLRVENKKRRDSTDLNVRIMALHDEFKTVATVDSVAGKLLERNIEEEANNYQHFVTNAYGTTLVLKSLIRATHEYAIVEKNKREAEYNRTKAALDWLKVDADSIPLTLAAPARFKHRPLVVSDNQLTMGLKFGSDSVATGYFYTVTASRVPDVKVSFPVDGPSFKKRDLPVIKGLAKGDEKAQLYYALVYSETKVEEKFPVTLAKIYRTDGLAWSNNFKLDQLPSELIINQETGELSIKITSSTGESKLVLVDKSGKVTP